MDTNPVKSSKLIGWLLDRNEILTLWAAVISADLIGSRSTLLDHISTELVATLPTAAVSAEQILMDLDALNTAGMLTDGKVPLFEWLGNAAVLADGRPEAKVFRDVLLEHFHQLCGLLREGNFYSESLECLPDKS